VTSLLVTAAEMHARADLGVVDAAEERLRPRFSPRCGWGRRRTRPGLTVRGTPATYVRTPESSRRSRITC
jgi:hypothetical protein